MVEMSCKVNQPRRWRRPAVVPLLKQEDTDVDVVNCLVRHQGSSSTLASILSSASSGLYSSGIPDQWLVHQIDTVHWFTGLPHPRSVVANGGIYLWKDGPPTGTP